MAAVEVRRGADRAVTRTPGIESRHTFAFGAHYDPANTSFGLLVTLNEDRLRAGTGYGPHPHRDLEIVTWVLSGSLRHEDSTGTSHVLRPGQVQRLSAGRGVTHSETNDAWVLEGGPPHDEPVHLVQTWLLPDTPGLEPGCVLVGVDLPPRGLVPLATGRSGHEAPVRLAQRDAALWVARLPAGGAADLPDAPYLHLHVVRGEVLLEGSGRLVAGDEARCPGGGGQRLTAAGAAEVLVWEMHARAGGGAVPG